MGAVSQWERESTAERTRDVLAHKRSNGERVGNIHSTTAFAWQASTGALQMEPAR
jgi:DNA invertase Pin-like site-specific DNA recombinase